ncbi:MAG: GDP-fucose synthetase [Deltaproteobacteria bacterium HGW-Deltaproteobacteria-15]|jgi:GDP-L-fucose synthase|nr:MAG: GDP-fucose synthetase [Deltaproteobacteria bacterium HGW-Deltaproteobacteria-15]
MNPDSKIYVAGHTGLVGSAVWRRLQFKGYGRLIGRRHAELDLERQSEVEAFFDKERPEYVFLAAARVGGILANSTYPAEFIYSNLAIQTNIIHASWKSGVKRLLFLGSSCIYPRECPQPMKESFLLSGPLESTNEPYAVAKIAGIKTCQAFNRQYGTKFYSVMPTNLYGPNDNFDLETSHVLPALIRKFHEAKVSRSESVEVWGSGNPRREFLHVDDLADACLFIMSLEDSSFSSLLADPFPLVNVGWGEDLSVKELAELVRAIVGYEGQVVFNREKPDGAPRKLLDVSRLTALGWQPGISLEEGIRDTYRWAVEERRI